MTILITQKMFSDTFYSNRNMAQIGGVTLENINEMESFFLQAIDWNLFIHKEELEKYDQGLAEYMQVLKQQ